MGLYYKVWNQDAIQIPDGSIIMNERDINLLKFYTAYPNMFCWEFPIINRIVQNEEGYFDFSKNLVDIGACLGEYCWTLHFNHAYAFEPCKDSLYRMHANIVLHDAVDRIDTYQVVLSDQVKDIEFNGYHTGIGGQTMKSTTLDSYDLHNVGLIKIDVEGAEYDVLNGSIGTIIRNNYPPILFEMWDLLSKDSYNPTGWNAEKRNRLIDWFTDHGYSILFEWGDWETHLAIHTTVEEARIHNEGLKTN